MPAVHASLSLSPKRSNPCSLPQAAFRPHHGFNAVSLLRTSGGRGGVVAEARKANGDREC